MRRFEVLSLAMTLAFLFLAAWRAWRQRRRPAVDVVMALIDGAQLRRHPMLVGFIFWICFAVISEVLVAWQTEGQYLATEGQYLTTTRGVLALVVFVVLVPVDVGAYFWLRTAAARFFSPRTLSELGLMLKETWATRAMGCRSLAVFVLTQALFILAALTIQTSAINSEICAVPSHSSRVPWVAQTAAPPSAIQLPSFLKCPDARTSQESVRESRELTMRGAIHYTIRGIGAYLAVNFLFVIFAVFCLLCFLVASRDPEKAFTRWHRPQPPIGELGLSLLIAVLFGVLATTFEGITLFLIFWNGMSGPPAHSFQSVVDEITGPAGSFRSLLDAWSQNQSLFSVAKVSTWLFWCAMSILVTGLTIGTIQRLRSFLEHGKDAIVTSQLEELEKYGRGTSGAEFETYWTTRTAIVAAAEKIETEPVRALKKLLGSAIILQIFALLPRALALLRSTAAP